MKQFVMRRLLTMLCASSFLSYPLQSTAAAFQLWEQDAATLGNYHAGYAAIANDASTAWYNPAGIPRIPDQQLVIGTNAIMASFKYRGLVTVSEPPFDQTFNVVAQGGTFNIVPFMHYVAPITDKIGFGFSVDAPFGLKTDFGRKTALKYAATLTALTVVNVSPSLGIKVTDCASIGFGFDIQKADAEFDSVGTLLVIPGSDTDSTNRANGTGYGFHAGALYEYAPDSRVGLSFHSQVVFHLTGSSKLTGPIANALNDGPLSSRRASARITLPPYTALSVYHRVNPQLAVMGSAIYTQWSRFSTLSLNNVAGAVSPEPFMIEPSTTIQVTVPEFYRNTWNFSLGSEYCWCDQVLLRAGVGYDQTPVRNAYRNAQLPDNNRYVISLGGHYQINPAIGVDLGWAHFFINQARVNPPPQVTGGQIVSTNGSANGGGDVFGGQVTWNM